MVRTGPRTLLRTGLVTGAVAGPNATALALDDHGARAGTASALLGRLQFVAGAAAAPLNGLFGGGGALPLAVVVAAFAVAAAAGSLLTRPRPVPVPAAVETVPAP